MIEADVTAETWTLRRGESEPLARYRTTSSKIERDYRPLIGTSGTAVLRQLAHMLQDAEKQHCTYSVVEPVDVAWYAGLWKGKSQNRLVGAMDRLQKLELITVTAPTVIEIPEWLPPNFSRMDRKRTELREKWALRTYKRDASLA